MSLNSAITPQTSWKRGCRAGIQTWGEENPVRDGSEHYSLLSVITLEGRACGRVKVAFNLPCLVPDWKCPGLVIPCSEPSTALSSSLEPLCTEEPSSDVGCRVNIKTLSWKLVQLDVLRKHVALHPDHLNSRGLRLDSSHSSVTKLIFVT